MAYEYTTQGYTVIDAGRRVVVDPVTRIEGHLRCEVNLNEQNVITNAVSCGTIFRGIEIILKGHDPRDAWAFVERICGVCTGTHAVASVQAVEDALGIEIPDNANIIRNMMQLCLMYHDHLVHTYHLAGLDWVDVVSASRGDPEAASALARKLSPWPNSSPGYFKSVRDRLLKVIESGNLGIFTNGYWGHPAYKLPPEANLMVVAHYLEALDFQKDVIHIHTIFGGKNPHPNWLVGGVPCSLNLDAYGAADVINQERLEYILQVIERCRVFAQQVVLPDTLALAGFYRDWLGIGGGLSRLSVLAYGGIPDMANDFSDKSLLLPRGAVINGNFEEVLPVNLTNLDEIQESVNHSWYDYPQGKVGLHPFDGVTAPNYQPGSGIKGTPTDLKQVDEQARYSWLKTPLWRGHQMEVGPLARMLVGYARKDDVIKGMVDDFCGRLNAPFTVLQSTLGRIAARSLELAWAAEKLRYFYDRLVTNLKNGNTSTANTQNWNPDTWPEGEVRGVGFTEAPRGALGHWTVIRNRKIERYQCIVPTTWNAAPRAPDGQLGAYEAALMGTRMDIPEQPLEILRTLHSFDPCLACATHIIGPDGSDLLTVRVDRGF